MKAINHTSIFKKYRGRWIVLDPSRRRVLASGMSLHDAVAAFHKRSKANPPSVMKVPSELLPYVGSTA